MSITKKDLKMKRMETEEQFHRLLKEYIAAGHRRPRSRREFLTAGLSTAGTMLFMPTVAQLISRSAWGAEIECAGSSGANFPAFINIQLNGGPALFANFLIRGSGGAPLGQSTYQMLGMGGTPRCDEDPASPNYGLLFANKAPFWIDDPGQPQSGFAMGLLKALPRTAGTPSKGVHDKTVFVGISAESIDDLDLIGARGTKGNDLSGMLAAAGIIGDSLPHLLSGYGAFLSEDFSPPVNQYAGAIIPSTKMLKVETAASIETSLAFRGAIGAMPGDMPTRLLAAIENLSKHQVDALANNPSSPESQKLLKRLISCSTEKNSDVIKGSNVADIYSASFPKGTDGTDIGTIWARDKVDADVNAQLIGKGLTAARMNDVITRVGLTVANVLRGRLASAATINLGGYDYHSSFYTRASAGLKDRFYGDIVGRILSTARAFNRPVFIHISTDGSVNNSNSTSPTVDWLADFPKRSMNYIIAYDPVKTPITEGYTLGNYSDAAYQLNHFTTGGVVATVNPIGSLDAQDLCGAAVFLNYLNFANRPDIIESDAMAKVRTRLAGAVPIGGGSIFDYFTRIKKPA